jgi:phenylacetic acid degradation operon negative regulatory protein
VFTLFGDYLLPREGPVWVGSLITLLGRLGMTPMAVRTALSRMTRRGWLVTTRRGARGYYELSARGRRLLEEGRQRIYHPPRRGAWDGRWTLITYSIPERRRELRDRLRPQLAWLGCGLLGNGAWITPHDVRDEVAAIARELRVTKHLELFRGEHLGYSSVAQLVAQCWDLPAVAGRYRDFISRWQPQLEHCGQCQHAGQQAVRGLAAQPCTSPEGCFERRFELVHEFRSFPLVDPFLPGELLPADWPGEAAAGLFDTYHAVLGGAAEAFVQGVCDAGEGANDPSPDPAPEPARAMP